MFISHECDCLDLGVLAYRLIEIYEWFADKCVELCNILDDTMGGLQLSLQDVLQESVQDMVQASLQEEAMAA